MTQYVSARTNKTATLVSDNGGTFTILLEDGTEKTIAASTFKRYWKEVEATDIVPAQDENVEETVVEEVTEEVTETVAQKKAREKKEKAAALKAQVKEADKAAKEEAKAEKERAKAEKAKAKEEKEKAKAAKAEAGPRVVEPHPLKAYIEAEAEKKGLELFTGSAKSLVSMKKDGKAVMAFTFTGKSVTLWLKAPACEHVTDDYNEINHLFGARIKMESEHTDNKKLITKLIASSIKYNDMKIKEAAAKKEAKNKKKKDDK